jgi:hypothetical protein
MRAPGSFGSRSTNRVDGCEPMFGEMLEALDHFVSEPSYQGQGGITERGEYFRRMTGTGTRQIFATADITYVMKTILDAPVRP